MGKLRRHLTFANVVSVVALFVALGGASYAAFELPKGSVGSAQLRKNSVNSSKVRDGSLLAHDFKHGQLPAGPQGPPGRPGSDATVNGIAAGGVLAGTYPNPSLRAAEGWHEVQSFDTCTVYPALIAWANVGEPWATAAYYRDQLGIVHLRGSVKCPEGKASDYSIFKLPPGYRPGAYREFLAATGFGAGTGTTGVSVGPEGWVSNSTFSSETTSGASARLSLDGIGFRCEPSGADGCP